jgi:hypothetical protein
MWRVNSSKTKKTRKIPVRPQIAVLTRQLMRTAPKGSTHPIGGFAGALLLIAGLPPSDAKKAKVVRWHWMQMNT